MLKESNHFMKKKEIFAGIEVLIIKIKLCYVEQEKKCKIM